MTKLDQQQLEIFKRDSILCLGQVFTAQEMALVRSAMDTVLRDSPQKVVIERENDDDPTSPIRSIMGWEQAHPVLDHFTRDKRVMDAIQSVIGRDIVFQQVKWNPKAPYSEGLPWDPHRGITFWHHRDGVQDPSKIVSVFIAGTEQTEENGATYTWLGAHKLTLEDIRQETDFGGLKEGETRADTGVRLSLQIKEEKLREYDERFEKKRIVGPAGTAWLLASENLHASAENGSAETRVLIANVFRALGNHPTHPRDKAYLCGTSRTPLESHDGEL